MRTRAAAPENVDTAEAAMRLLLGDEHRVFVESLALVLGAAGFQVVAVTHAPDQTLAALRRHRVDVGVLDVSCAPVSVLRQVGRVGAAPRIVVLSGRPADPADPRPPDALVAAALAYGVRGFADKSQSLAEIIDMIERVHHGEIVFTHPPGREPGVIPVPVAGPAVGATPLTGRERETMSLLVRGADTNAIARQLGITRETARSHVQSVLKKLGAHTRVEAAAAAVRRGLVDAATGEWLRS